MTDKSLIISMLVIEVGILLDIFLYFKSGNIKKDNNNQHGTMRKIINFHNFSLALIVISVLRLDYKNLGKAQIAILILFAIIFVAEIIRLVIYKRNRNKMQVSKK